MSDVVAPNTDMSLPLGVPPAQTGVDVAPIKRPAPPAETHALLDEWLSDESGYDEQVWPELKSALGRNRSGARSLFDG